jgi:hypothetical protein
VVRSAYVGMNPSNDSVIADAVARSIRSSVAPAPRSSSPHRRVSSSSTITSASPPVRCSNRYVMPSSSISRAANSWSDSRYCTQYSRGVAPAPPSSRRSLRPWTASPAFSTCSRICAALIPWKNRVSTTCSSSANAGTTSSANRSRFATVGSSRACRTTPSSERAVPSRSIRSSHEAPGSADTSMSRSAVISSIDRRYGADSSSARVKRRTCSIDSGTSLHVNT